VESTLNVAFLADRFKEQKHLSMSCKNLISNSLVDLPELMERLGDGDYARPRTYCPFCQDTSKSFSVTKGPTAVYRWRCGKCIREGGVLEYLMLRNGISQQDAYLAHVEISASLGGLWVSREHREGYRAGRPHLQVVNA
jgi:hypothetical protein